MAHTKSLGWAIGDPLHRMYSEHCARAVAEGFTQMPFGKYIKLHTLLYWGIEDKG